VIKVKKGNPAVMHDAGEPTMFTPYERRQLRLIEEWFEQDDPHLASALRAGPVRRPSVIPQIALITLACALAAVGIVTGVFILVLAGVVTGVAASCVSAGRKHKKRR
jgi:hypothetical protein